MSKREFSGLDTTKINAIFLDNSGLAGMPVPYFFRGRHVVVHVRIRVLQASSQHSSTTSTCTCMRAVCTYTYPKSVGCLLAITLSLLILFLKRSLKFKARSSNFFRGKNRLNIFPALFFSAWLLLGQSSLRVRGTFPLFFFFFCSDPGD